jgi:hypothetical protein
VARVGLTAIKVIGEIGQKQPIGSIDNGLNHFAHRTKNKVTLTELRNKGLRSRLVVMMDVYIRGMSLSY